MEEILSAVFAGLIQGVTEWLPVSSKTLLLIFFLLWGIEPGDAYLLGLLLNGVTAAIVFLYFRREFVSVFFSVPKPLSPEPGARLLRFLFTSLAVTGVLGVPLASLSSHILLLLTPGKAMMLVGFLLGFTALANWWRMRLGGGMRTVGDASALDGLLTGVAQAFSALPGISRSGSTLLALMLLGFRPRDALILSFVIGAPASLAGTLYVFTVSPVSASTLEPLALFSAAAAASLTSIPVISLLLSASQKIRAHLFAAVLAFLAFSAGLLLG